MAVFPEKLQIGNLAGENVKRYWPKLETIILFPYNLAFLVKLTERHM